MMSSQVYLADMCLRLQGVQFDESQRCSSVKSGGTVLLDKKWPKNVL